MSEIKNAPEIGPQLQALRKQRKLTLEALAKQSGVSRSMLSQIERSEANPTFATLWNLTHALGIDLNELTGGLSEVTRDTLEVLEPHFTPEIKSEDGACVLRILGPVDKVGTTEWYEVLIAPGGELSSSAHASGTREHLTTLEGTFHVTAGAATNVAAAGATARYPADKPHAIANKSKTPARGLLVVMSG